MKNISNWILLGIVTPLGLSQAAITFSAPADVPNNGVNGGFAGVGPSTSGFTLNAIGHNETASGVVFEEIVGSVNPFSIGISSSVPLGWALQDTGAGGRALDFRVPGGLLAGQSITITATFSESLGSTDGLSGTNAAFASTISRFDPDQDPMTLAPADLSLTLAPIGGVDLTAMGIANESNGFETGTLSITAGSITGVVDPTASAAVAAFRDNFNDGQDGGRATGFTYTITNNGPDNGPGDATYRITFDGTPISVPEPSSSLLVVLSGALLLGRRTRK